jgi:hypothetical protein
VFKFEHSNYASKTATQFSLNKKNQSICFYFILFQEPATINHLPPEILLIILSYVPTKDLILRVSLVSRTFRQLIQDPNSHLAVTLHDAVSIKAAVAFIKRSTMMYKLKLTKSSR